MVAKRISYGREFLNIINYETRTSRDQHISKSPIKPAINLTKDIQYIPLERSLGFQRFKNNVNFYEIYLPSIRQLATQRFY